MQNYANNFFSNIDSIQCCKIKLIFGNPVEDHLYVSIVGKDTIFHFATLRSQVIIVSYLVLAMQYSHFKVYLKRFSKEFWALIVLALNSITLLTDGYLVRKDNCLINIFSHYFLAVISNQSASMHTLNQLRGKTLLLTYQWTLFQDADYNRKMFESCNLNEFCNQLTFFIYQLSSAPVILNHF